MRDSVTEYLSAMGVAAILIVQTGDGSCRICVGPSRYPHGAVQWKGWVDSALTARRIVKHARQLLRSGQPAEQAVEAAAASIGAKITSDDIVIARAAAAAARLQSAIAAMTNAGLLHRFHDEYRRRRQAALAKGRNFIPFATAQRRLRRSLIRRLTNATMMTEWRTIFEEALKC